MFDSANGSSALTCAELHLGMLAREVLLALTGERRVGTAIYEAEHLVDGLSVLILDIDARVFGFLSEGQRREHTVRGCAYLEVSIQCFSEVSGPSADDGSVDAPDSVLTGDDRVAEFARLEQAWERSAKARAKRLGRGLTSCLRCCTY